LVQLTKGGSSIQQAIGHGMVVMMRIARCNRSEETVTIVMETGHYFWRCRSGTDGGSKA